MARRPRLFAPGLLYHVIVRGNQNRKTFLDERDYRTYLDLLVRYRQRYKFTIHAYCLMPNHVHLLLESGDQSLGKFMQGLQQSYSQHFNLRHRKVGHVFQGRYKAIVCQKDAYLLELIRYIHLNPVRAALVRDPERYLYSGEKAYWDGKVTEAVDPRRILALLGGKAGYRRFVRNGLGQGHNKQFYEVEDQRFLGAAGFGQKLAGAGVEPRRARRTPLDAAVKKLGRELKVSIPQLISADRRWDVSKLRTMISYVLVRRQGYGLSEVAKYFGRDSATTGTLLGRFAERMETNARLKREIARLSKKVEI
jgi:REP element-mobilizing transposase RayT